MSKEKLRATFALLVFNQEEYIEGAVRSALEQDYASLQIIIADDASSDKTAEIAQQIVESYVGPHQVVLKKNQVNVGIGAQINKIMEIADGDFIVAAAGDDVSALNRVSKLADFFEKDTGCTHSVWSGASYIDSSGGLLERPFPGREEPFSEKSIARNIRPVIGATHAWRREVFEFFGPLIPGVMFEDNAISFRSYLLGNIGYLPDNLVDYRVHENNITNFAKNSNNAELYRAAARRAQWALLGVEQRLTDLAKFIENKPDSSRDTQLLGRELARQRRIYERRVRAYTNFPSVSFSQVRDALGDIEVLKVLVRALTG